MIEHAEEYVRSRGFSIFRVRYLARADDQPVAKLQIAPEEMKRLPPLVSEIQEALRAIGFGDLVVDPDGYKAPGSLQSGIPKPQSRFTRRSASEFSSPWLLTPRDPIIFVLIQPRL